MSIAAQIGAVKERYDQIERSTDFISLARLLLNAKGQAHVARDLARTSPRVPDRVKRIFAEPGASDLFVRASVPPATLAGTQALTEYKIAAAGFAASLANIGVWDRLLGQGFRTLPMSLVSVGAVNISAVAAALDEAGTKPVASLSLTASTVTIRKAAALLVLTSELARAVDGMVDTIIGRELRVACVKAIDGKFLAIATAGAPTFASSGGNLAAFFTDLANALNVVAIDDTSRLYIVMTSANAKQLSLMLASGSATTTAMTPQNGTIVGVPVIVSDSLGAGQWALIDASAFAAASDLLSLSTLTSASVDMLSSPDSPQTPSTNFYNLWQLNQIALLAERFFFVERLRANSVALITGATYAPSGFSP
jgi:hypothetical protein